MARSRTRASTASASLRSLRQIQPGRQGGNLIVVEAAAQIAGAAEAAADDACDAAERLIRALPAEHFPVLREMIQIEHQEAQAA